MKIKIKSDEGDKFNFWLPNSLLKSKFILKCMIKYGGKDLEPLLNSLPIMYKALKEYIKKHGHFVLVDVESSDGNKVFITV